MPDTGTSGRVRAFDGLRALAVSLVFLTHIDTTKLPGGFLGVDLFFVLSGYLITGLLLRERERHGAIWLRGFYMRRWLRLTPAVAVLVPVCLVVALIEDIGQPFRDAAATLFYVMDIWAPVAADRGGIFAHTWSLAVEEQFYLVWPPLLVLCLRRRLDLRAVAVAGIGLFMVLTVLVLKTADISLYRSPFPHVPELGVGVLLAVVMARRPSGASVPWVVRSAVPSAVVLAGLVGALFVVDANSLWLYLGGYVVIACLLAVVVAHTALVGSSGLSRGLRVRPAVWLGERSYGFYLWHYPVLAVLALHVDSWLARGLLGLVASLALTVLSWRFVEQPFLRRKVRYERAALQPAAR